MSEATFTEAGFTNVVFQLTSHPIYILLIFLFYFLFFEVAEQTGLIHHIITEFHTIAGVLDKVSLSARNNDN